MPAPAPFTSAQPLYPALYLYPLNDSFIPKHIYLPPNTKVKIGRQTNAKTAPGERNGYFDSKVLSRQHAEVWEENGKIYIRDVKSSNGTFINGDRLSGEGLESDPYDLKSEDIVEFGIDIVGEDNKTIIHHKVSARVVCIFSEHDAQVALRAEQNTQQQQHLPPQQQHQQYSGPSSSFNFNANPPPRRQVGAPTQNGPANQLGSLGGPNMRPPGKSSISFEHILNRLQGELQKSRETGAELHTITGAMGDIHDTLGGNLPPNVPPYPHSLPPVRQPQQLGNGDGIPQEQSTSPEPQPPRPSSSHGSPDAMQGSLSSLEKEITSAQSSLLAQMEKLNDVLDEQEKIRDEVRRLREVVYVEHRDKHEEEEERGSGFDEDDEGEGETMEDDDDDARSVATLVPHELERVDEVDEEHLENADEHREDEQRRDDNLSLGRPRTPEPTHLGMRDRQPHQPSPLSNDASLSASIDDLAARMSELTAQLESALALSSSLQAKHAEAQDTISRLEQKIGVLETLITTKSEKEELPAPPPVVETTASPSEEVSKILSNYKTAFDQQFAAMREEWNAERERMRVVEERVALTASTSHATALPNGDATSKLTGGLVTPPSPRSPARKRRSGSRRRSRSGSRSEEGASDAESVSTGATKVEFEGKEKGFADAIDRGLVTPEHSLRGGMPGYAGNSDIKDDMRKAGGFRDARTTGSPANAQAAVGVLVLSIAAAAVIWRVKD
ncbi:hypothetical protein BD626DRAFT_482302 [Schizophyllum amplum]|uniref:FHA domain-containing protein n=1 Tax=Schizophyllum amplum TaxID=97359 RepID=A0A550CV17_9AGAR|nr:hypothetical protein BD626DRAFT_482302 [Auriculariopsis ampla]